MKLLIQGGRVIDPQSGRDEIADVAIGAGRIVAIGSNAQGFEADRTIDATGCCVSPGLIDLCVRLKEPGYEHEGMLESETAAAVAGGITSLVCPPDTDPVLDESGLVDMLKFRAERMNAARVFPLGAVTRALQGEVLTEMAQLHGSGCVGFSQAEKPIANTQVLQRAMQYAATFGFALWLRPQDAWLGNGVAASGPLATRMGLAGIPVASEVIALHTLFTLQRSTRARLHLCRISSAAGLELVRQAKAEGLPVTCDVSVHNLHLIDVDLGYFDSRAHLTPPLRQHPDREALRKGLADGTIDALVSDHNPVEADAKAQPFAESEAGASSVELLLSLSLKWAHDCGLSVQDALRVLTNGPVSVLGDDLGSLQSSVGQLVEGGVADLCVFDPNASRITEGRQLRSQGKFTPFEGVELFGQVRCTIVNGQLAYVS